MFKTLSRTFCLVAALAAGATAIGTAPAAADGFRFGITIGDGPRHLSPAGHRGDRWDRGHRRGRGYYGRGCSPREAVHKARRIGIHRARVVDVGHRSVAVAGRSRGDRTLVRFARAPGCPVLRIRG
ncbi:MAG: hypothetical protein KAG89_13215 [Fulvimarina manganoxydans]|uniref:hypothetical protein n=1 Tax=Fulvimarina manganoxydans TaxID=937218 RepID=UPI0023554A35|nr:hypothetical protein [Fulvimarina manganoxydans]MCK5933120.1 hypothetical protein [Fulvimarina manganoxydans]